MSNRNFEDVTGGSDNPRWEPHKNENNPKYPKVLEGYLRRLREINGPNGMFMVAEIAMVNPDGTPGKLIDVSGGVSLEDNLQKVPCGSYIQITFKGKKPSKTPGRTYNDWHIGIDKNAIPYATVFGNGAVTQSAPLQNTATTQTGNAQPNQGWPQQGGNQGQAQQTNNFQPQGGNTFGGNNNFGGNNMNAGFNDDDLPF